MGFSKAIGGAGRENLQAQLDSQEAIIADLESKVQSVSAVDMITPVNEQTLTIQDIQEALVGKAQGANATAETILEGYSAYVGQNLINGTYVPPTITVDGVEYDQDLSLQSFTSDIPLTDLPISIQNRLAVVLNNEIHILSGTEHYKFDGSDWTSVSTIPVSALNRDIAVVLNNEIHIIKNGVNKSTHYKWDGSSWTSVSELTYEIEYGCGVVLNGEIHILGSYNDGDEKKHYKWDGSSWTSVSTLPNSFYNGDAFVINNEIHVGGHSILKYQKKHYKWDGSSWTSVSELPFGFKDGKIIVLDDEIHILGGDGDTSTTNDNKKHYKYVTGTGWTNVSPLPYSFISGSAVVFNNEINILGSTTEGYYNKHYIVQGTAYYRKAV